MSGYFIAFWIWFSGATAVNVNTFVVEDIFGNEKVCHLAGLENPFKVGTKEFYASKAWLQRIFVDTKDVSVEDLGAGEVVLWVNHRNINENAKKVVAKMQQSDAILH